MLMVNLFAGPSAGKTVLRALLFAELKMSGSGLDVEETIEVAREHVREGRELALRNRIKMLGDQYHRGFRFRFGQGAPVDVVVSDSPVLLNAVYARREGTWPQAYLDLCRWAHDQDESLNVWVERQEGHAFQQGGRREDPAECARLDGEIRGMLHDQGIPYVIARSTPEDARSLAGRIIGLCAR